MKYKIIFGITIPLIAIIALALVASYGEVSVTDNFLKTISVSEILENGEMPSAIKIGNLTLSNNYSLTKRYNLPLLQACLYDRDGTRAGINAGNVEYNRWDRTPYQDTYLRQTSDKNVEVKSGETRDIELTLIVSSIFWKLNYSTLSEQYGEYEELIIFEKSTKKWYENGYMYTSCSNINENTLNDAIVIQLTY